MKSASPMTSTPSPSPAAATGKGRAAIIPNMLRYAGSVLAIDPKGELATETAEVRAQTLGQQVCDSRSLRHDRGRNWPPYHKGFNPIAQMRSESAVEDAVLIADALVVPEAARSALGRKSARTFLEGVILDVVTSPALRRAARPCHGARSASPKESRTTSAIDDDDDDDEDEERSLPKGMSLLRDFMRESDHPAVRRAAADFFERPDARTRLRPLDDAAASARAVLPGNRTRRCAAKASICRRSRPGARPSICACPARHMGTVRTLAAALRQSGAAGDGAHAGRAGGRLPGAVRAR